MLKSIRRRWHSQKVATVIRRSDLFNEGWYLKKYPDVLETKLDAAKHYVIYGEKEGRDPSVSFSTRAYFEIYPDVEAMEINPLYHYIKWGKSEGRLPVSVAAFQELSGAKHTIKILEKENTLLANQLHQTNEELSGAKHTIKILEKENTLLANQLHQANEELEILKADCDRQNSRIGAFQDKVELLTNEREELFRLADDHMCQINQLNSELQQAHQATHLATKLRTLRESDLKDLQDRYRELMLSHERQNKLIHALEKRLHIASKYFHNLQYQQPLPNIDVET